eukprot:TRINITY_DN19563_c0_g3_i1.p1 TRINITY_DN19563_c0_g3~~TRINITY_DN19563_c0_g3_i1.p1  ORF type:complete len:429 (+),score=78.63 TRINITY_DN19563_c0_g3_i1:253-1539(+)
MRERSALLFPTGNAMECPVDYGCNVSAWRIGMWTLWGGLVLLLSIPVNVYVLSTSLPGDNTLGLSRTTLDLFMYGGGPMLYVITSLMIPPLARRTVRICTGGTCPATASQLMAFGRVFVTLLTPCCGIVLLSQDCFAGWLAFWEPCNQEASFNISFLAKIVIDSGFGQYVLFHNFELIQHSDVCSPRYDRTTSCSRAVIDTAGSLVLSKLWFSTLIGPLLTLITNTETFRTGWEWIVHTFLRQKRYKMSWDLDTEASGVVMALECILLFGFPFPAMVPLVCLNLALHAIAFQISLRHLSVLVLHESAPPIISLWISHWFGTALVLWSFYDCGWDGRLLVYIGVPIGMVAGGAIPLWNFQDQFEQLDNQNHDSGMAGLVVPLLDRDMGDSSEESPGAKPRSDNHGGVARWSEQIAVIPSDASLAQPATI